jgi:hypothetical protein
MKFPRFLAFGSSLSGLESKPKTYRLVDSGLPRLSEAKTPELPTVGPTGPLAATAGKARSPFSPVGLTPRRREGVIRQLWGRLSDWACSWIPARKPSRIAVQTELSLDAVRPLRSRLMDDDLKVVMEKNVPVKPAVAVVDTTPLAIEAPAAPSPEPFEGMMRRTRWNRLSGWFRPAEKEKNAEKLAKG